MSSTILRSVGKGRSFFSFVEDYCPSEKDSANRSIHRLCSLMRKMDAETAAIESIDDTFPEVKEEFAALRDRHEGSSIDIKAFRISFITEKIKTLHKVVKIPDSKFLASVIIINFNVDGCWSSYLFRAIVALPGTKRKENINWYWSSFLFRTIAALLGVKRKVDRDLLLNNYIHVYKTFQCEIRISETCVRTFNIVGTYFCQQNNATSVCGHASLCMTINNMVTYKGEIITPEHINRSIGTNHKKTKFGSGVGLSIENIRTALDSFGLKYTQIDFIPNQQFEYDSVIHKYIEGGYPTLLIFNTKNALHVVTVLGHTLNTDLWRPEAEYAYIKPQHSDDYMVYRPASEWVDNFIIHDDNFGMYQCMQVDSLKRETNAKTDPTFRAYYAVMITPDDVKTFAYEAEYASVKITKDLLLMQKNSFVAINDWLERILLSDSLKMISVARTMLVRREDYSRSLGETDFDGNTFTDIEKEEIINDLPDLFWLSEITLPDLYTANKTKLIDFFYPTNLPPLTDINDIYKRWIQIRFPEALIKNKENQLTVFEMSVLSHYPLFRKMNGPIVPEW